MLLPLSGWHSPPNYGGGAGGEGLEGCGGSLLHKHKEHGHDEACECCKVVPLEWLALETYDCEDCEYGECYNLLYYLQLHECEWSSVFTEPIAVGWYHEDVLCKCHAPRKEDDGVEWSVLRKDLHLLKLEMTVPCKGHEDVGYDQQSNCDECVHIRLPIIRCPVHPLVWGKVVRNMWV